MTWTCQIFDGNPLTSYAVVFLEAAGFSTNATFDLNMCVNAYFLIGPLICFSLMPHFGRRTIYMTGLAGMLVIQVVVGHPSPHRSLPQTQDAESSRVANVDNSRLAVSDSPSITPPRWRSAFFSSSVPSSTLFSWVQLATRLLPKRLLVVCVTRLLPSADFVIILPA